MPSISTELLRKEEDHEVFENHPRETVDAAGEFCLFRFYGICIRSFHKNYGTNANREFHDRIMLKADGEVISLTSG
jgi:hypothetical protein